jgi:plasmid stabilization system protein ParE
VFKIEISLNAQEELENIESFYFKISEKVANNYILNLSKTCSILEINPFFGIRYKNYRAVTIDKFP